MINSKKFMVIFGLFLKSHCYFIRLNLRKIGLFNFEFLWGILEGRNNRVQLGILSYPEKQPSWQFSSFFEIFYKKMHDPHYIWLFLTLILSIPHYFVISYHENHISFWFWKKEYKKKIFTLKRNFKLTSNLK